MVRMSVHYENQKENPLLQSIFFEQYDIKGHFHSENGYGHMHVGIPNTEEAKKELMEFVENHIEGKVTRVDEWEI